MHVHKNVAQQVSQVSVLARQIDKQDLQEQIYHVYSTNESAIIEVQC
jgi:hypothetical protein